LMSLEKPKPRSGIRLMGTTVQVFSHSWVAYLRNSAKRRRPANLWTYLRHGYALDWASSAEPLLQCALVTGGVFHLWGHSWEIEETKQWEQLARVFAVMARYKDRIRCVTNSELCELA
jgi:peptidoglycan-N-acetylglucosamine deacetylase